MRHGDSRASALWGKGEGRWRRGVVCLTAVAALCTPGSALAAGQKADAPAAAPATELAGPTADPAPVFTWLANWTW
jgi:hypothetical protein